MTFLKDFILVKEPLVEEKKTSGGIIVSTEEKVNPSDPIVNLVDKVGSDVKTIKEGDRVLYLPREGLLVKRSETNWRILKEENIIAVMDKDEVLWTL